MSKGRKLPETELSPIPNNYLYVSLSVTFLFFSSKVELHYSRILIGPVCAFTRIMYVTKTWKGHNKKKVGKQTNLPTATHKNFQRKCSYRAMQNGYCSTIVLLGVRVMLCCLPLHMKKKIYFENLSLFKYHSKYHVNIA